MGFMIASPKGAQAVVMHLPVFEDIGIFQGYYLAKCLHKCARKRVVLLDPVQILAMSSEPPRACDWWPVVPENDSALACGSCV